jgi:thiamine biosynthesis lipoprotein
MTVSTELAVTFTSMASDIEIRVVDPAPDAQEAVGRAVAAIGAIATHLTRFDPESALSKANRAPGRLARGSPPYWPRPSRTRTRRPSSPTVCSTPVSAEHAGGVGLRQDVRTDRVRIDRDDAVGHRDPPHPSRHPTPRATWEPSVTGTLINLGGSPIDLGGIGKGLAVRHAAAALADAGGSVLVDAGGDEWLAGPGPDGDGWKVGVEDPLGRDEHVLVLAVTDLGVATSSIARQRWTVRGVPVHHLVDPRTLTPGGAGLAAVTVLHPDPAWAEVWSKTLYLTGAADIAASAASLDLAAAWVTVDGEIGLSDAIRPFVLWQVAR